MDNRNYYHDYLIHHGVKGMKWGVRRYQTKDGILTPAGKRAKKKRDKYLNEAKYKAEAHKSNADFAKKKAKDLRSMSDSDYAKRFDDDEFLKEIGGAKKAKAEEIQYFERKTKDYTEYAKTWMNIHDEIMNTPIGELRSNKDYREIRNRHLNYD